MQWTERQILDTLRLIEESDYDEVRLETGDFKLHVRKSGAPPQLENATPLALAASVHGSPARTPTSASRSPAVHHAETPVTRAPVGTQDAAPSTRTAALKEDGKQVVVPEGMVAIRAPMIGTFYRAAAPSLPPFVEVGANVQPDDTVCLVEVMKLFNTIKAGVAGRVVRILAQNAATIERDEVLMIIEPQRARQ